MLKTRVKGQKGSFLPGSVYLDPKHNFNKTEKKKAKKRSPGERTGLDEARGRQYFELLQLPPSIFLAGRDQPDLRQWPFAFSVGVEKLSALHNLTTRLTTIPSTLTTGSQWKGPTKPAPPRLGDT